MLASNTKWNLIGRNTVPTWSDGEPPATVDGCHRRLVPQDGTNQVVELLGKLR